MSLSSHAASGKAQVTLMPPRNIISPQSGQSFWLYKGDQLTVIDPQGGQVSDLYAVMMSDAHDPLSSGRTIDYLDKSLSEMIPSAVRTATNIHVTRLQNIPNPFDATTKITFDLERNAFVSLKILDILGKEVSVLVSEELPAGTYTRDWNASAFPPGEYFYRLQAGAYSETNKLMLVK